MASSRLDPGFRPADLGMALADRLRAITQSGLSGPFSTRQPPMLGTGECAVQAPARRPASSWTSAAVAAACLRMSSVMRIEQNLGPHMLQNAAVLKASCGSVSSCIRRAVSGSSDSRNCSSQLNVIARARQGVVAVAGAGAVPGEVGGVGRDLVGDHALADVFDLGQAQVLLGRHVAEHAGPVPAGQGRADGRGDVVVARGDVGHERARARRTGPRCTRSACFSMFMAIWSIGTWPGPSTITWQPRAWARRVSSPRVLQLGELGGVGGVGDAAGPQAVAQAERDVVLPHDVAEVVEVRVERVLLVVGDHPLGHERAAPRDDPGDPMGRQRDVVAEDAGVDRHVVDALLGLVLDHVEQVASPRGPRPS